MKNRIDKIRSFLSNKLSHNGLLSLADQFVASLTNFLTGVIIGRTCAQEEFGLYMLCFSTILLVADVQMSLISAPYMVFSQRLTGKRLARYTGSIFIHQVVLSAFLVLILVAAGILFTWTTIFSYIEGYEHYSTILWTMAVTVSFVLLRDYLRKVSFARLKMMNALFIDAISGVIQLLGLSLLATYGLLSASNAYWVIGIACGITSLLWFARNRELFSFSGLHSLADFRKNWRFSKWVFLSGMLWAVGMTLYPWFLATFHGTAETAIWGACFAIAALGNPLRLGVQNFLGPKVVQAYLRGGIFYLSKFVIKAACLFALIVLPFCLILFWYGDLLVISLYGEKYGGNGLIVTILALNMLVGSSAFALSRAFLAMERSDLFFRANFVPLVFLFTAGLFLVKKYATLGVAMALISSTMATSIVMLIMFIKLLINARARQKAAAAVAGRDHLGS